ncbi:50S ribosomal protein L15e [Candidatus Micrarchaeota archaeon]|nr:50S ribosomal protein L15e [Candidatus Micrarchaeota archaeon]
MGYAKYVRASFAKSAKERSESYTLRLRKWRKQPVVNRADGPTNPVRARELGYKAAPGYVIARVRIRRGRHRRRQPDLGRKPGRNRKRVEPGRELKWYAQNRAARRFANLTPVNAYWVGEDGVYKYFEVILRDDNASTPNAYRQAKKAEAEKIKAVALQPRAPKEAPAKKKAAPKKSKADAAIKPQRQVAVATA